MRSVLFFSVFVLWGCADGLPVADVRVTIEPSEPTTLDDLRAVAEDLGTAAGHLSYEWRRDGADAGFVGDDVPSEATQKGEQWSVLVWPSAGLRSEGVEASVVIANSPPRATVHVQPQDPRSSDELRAVAEGEDPDSDAVRFSYAWTVDGSPTAVTTAFVDPGLTGTGERWEVTVTPNDGEADGEPASAMITVGNRTPVIDRVVIEPSTFTHGTPIEAVVYASDPDGDALEERLTWFVDEEPQTDVGNGIDPFAYTRDSVVRVEAVVSDGASDSAPVSSIEYVVENSPPSIAGAQIEARDGVYNGRGIDCVVEDPADVDGDTLSLRYTWYADGRAVGSGKRWTVSAPRGAEIQCGAVANDGIADSEQVRSSSGEVLNTAPGVPTLKLSHATPNAHDTLTVTPSAVDPDGDALTYTYAWTVNGRSASSKTNSLDLSPYKRGDLIRVTVTANDGLSASLPRVMGISMSNAPPTASTRPGITPSSPGRPSTIRCLVIRDAVDGDGDALTYRVLWNRYRGSTSVSLGRTPTTTSVTDDTLTGYHAVSDSYGCQVLVSDGTASVVSKESPRVTIR